MVRVAFLALLACLVIAGSATAIIPAAGNYDMAGGGADGCAFINPDGSGTTNTQQFGNGDMLKVAVVWVPTPGGPRPLTYHKVCDAQQPGNPHVANIGYESLGDGKYRAHYSTAGGTPVGVGTWCPKPIEP